MHPSHGQHTHTRARREPSCHLPLGTTDREFFVILLVIFLFARAKAKNIGHGVVCIGRSRCECECEYKCGCTYGCGCGVGGCVWVGEFEWMNRLMMYTQCTVCVYMYVCVRVCDRMQIEEKWGECPMLGYALSRFTDIALYIESIINIHPHDCTYVKAYIISMISCKYPS